ncbi:hypothetical protein ACFVJS_03890 [Nocardioides sp. NPDC057772]|uniref:hypothetical protein n=1 Tax=Nocardioides sp. NPDC057772 TaxID=3346245 RepID=UPI0036735179
MTSPDAPGPWWVQWAWKDGISGATSFRSKELAEERAEHIRKTAKASRREVNVTVEYVERPDTSSN